MHTWNTLLESYQHRVDKNTHARVKLQIRWAENPMAAVVVSVEAAHVHKAILRASWTSEVALEEPQI
jgi:hypothetical protein